MEENPLHDNMDDYVKKSFENYEENPSGDMWSRIARELPEPEEKRRPIVLYWRNGGILRWAAAAVFVLLVGRWGYLEFGPERDNPSPSDVATMHENAKPLFNNPVADNAGSNKKEQGPTEVVSHPLSENGQTNGSDQQAEGLKKINAYSGRKTQVNPSTSGIKKESKQTKAPRSEAERLAIPPTQQTDQINPSKLGEETTSNQNDVEGIAANATLNTGSVKVQNIDIQTIEKKNFTIFYNPELHFPLVNPPLKPIKSAANWYVGMALGPQFALGEKVQTVQQNNGRYRFSNQAERPSTTIQAGVQIGHTLGRHFALESGLNYQYTKRYAVHRPQIEYRESRLISSGSGTESRSFDYDLNTYGGSAAVSLNMEVRGNQIPAATERVKMSIRTREQITRWQMPLLAVFRSGKGRLQATLKAGLSASYLVDNQLNIESFGLENPRLRPRSIGRAFTINYDRPSDFVFGYMAAAGLEYSISDRLRLQFLPAFQGEFARKDANGGKLPTQSSLGVTAAVSWWF